MHNHIKKLYEKIASGEIPEGGSHNIMVVHEDDCDFMNKRGECNCDCTLVPIEPKGQG